MKSQTHGQAFFSPHAVVFIVTICIVAVATAVDLREWLTLYTNRHFREMPRWFVPISKHEQNVCLHQTSNKMLDLISNSWPARHLIKTRMPS